MTQRSSALSASKLLVALLLILLSVGAASAFIIHPARRYSPHSAKAMDASATAPAEEHVLATLHANQVLEVTLSRPRQLNALSTNMLRTLTRHMEVALGSPDVQAVLLTTSDPRAFCAGGDVKEILQHVKSLHEQCARSATTDNLPGTHPATYTDIEYRLDSLIWQLSRQKPVIALSQGIVMGGGAGIFQGASLRIVTPSAVFAMPECRIAILPDAGATYFLMRTPGEVATYAALTGARLSGKDMLAVGLATHLVDPLRVPELLNSIRSGPVTSLDSVLAKVAEPRDVAIADAAVLSRLDTINRVFSASTVQEAKERLEAEIELQEGEAWLRQALEALTTECPASHVVTLHAIRTGQRAGTEWGIDRALGMEWLANARLGVRRDFVEGVETAVGSRRGEAPDWQPKTWEEAAREVGDIVALMSGKQPLQEVLQHQGQVQAAEL